RQLRAALAAFDRLGARPWAARALTELIASGESARVRDDNSRHSLTPQELQVALALAEGRTTREAAAKLYLSPKAIAYHLRNVDDPLPTADGRPPLLMIGQPMDASGFSTLASHFPDRTVITYDPRGLGRSIRKDGRVDNAPTVQADDVHAVIGALGAGPVEMF